MTDYREALERIAALTEYAAHGPSRAGEVYGIASQALREEAAEARRAEPDSPGKDAL
jgi:hypothetical protein